MGEKDTNSHPDWFQRVQFCPANPTDVPQCVNIESASYPPDEAASQTSLEYRQQHANTYFRCAVLDDDKIIGFVCATRCNAFAAESMSTHVPGGTLLAIHSVVVEESYRKYGLATRMLQNYISVVKEMNDGVEKIVALAKSHLLGFYVNCGFTVTKPSSISHGKDLWYELEIHIGQSDNKIPSFEDGVKNIIDSPFLSDAQSDIANRRKKAKIALVILNTPIPSPPSPYFKQLWDISTFHVCADGGANRLHDATVTTTMRDEYIPELIRGDLDSLRSDVRAYYASKGVKIERDPDQNTNDLDKALQVIVAQPKQHSDEEKETWVYIYGAFGGRFDQEMASIQALYKWRTRFNDKIFLYNDETCAFILPPLVCNEIRLPFYGNAEEEETKTDEGGKVCHGEGPTCGLIPMGCKCDYVQTTGFKWNIDGDIPLEFGGLVSTSNHANEKTMTVKCSEPIIFTAEMNKMPEVSD